MRQLALGEYLHSTQIGEVFALPTTFGKSIHLLVQFNSETPSQSIVFDATIEASLEGINWFDVTEPERSVLSETLAIQVRDMPGKFVRVRTTFEVVEGYNILVQ